MTATRELGSTGLRVSTIGLGTWQLGGSDAWGPMNEEEALRIVHRALAEGCNLFDSAPNYGFSRSETLLGRALRGRRHEAVLVSKFGHRATDGVEDFSQQAFWESLHGSLQRLQTDYLDVLLLHSPPPQLLEPRCALWDDLREARAQGKIRHFGASVDRAQEIRRVSAVEDLSVLEVLFNVLQQDARLAFPELPSPAPGIIAKVPLDSGWLGGRYDANSRFSGVRDRWSPTDIAQRADAVARVQALLPDGVALTEAALAYLLSYRELSSVIPGARSETQLLANLACADKHLPVAVVSALEELWETLTDHGALPLPW